MWKIRLAEAPDDGVIGELLVSSFLSTYARKMPEVRLTERRLAELRDVAKQRRDSQVIVAVDGERLIGTAALHPPADSRPDAAEIRRMAVLPEYHGRGVSTALLGELHRRAMALGARRIRLYVRRGAHGIARAYRRHGYRRVADEDKDLLPEVFLEAYFREL